MVILHSEYNHTVTLDSHRNVFWPISTFCPVLLFGFKDFSTLYCYSTLYGYLKYDSIWPLILKIRDSSFDTSHHFRNIKNNPSCCDTWHLEIFFSFFVWHFSIFPFIFSLDIFVFKNICYVEYKKTVTQYWINGHISITFAGKYRE